MMLIGVRTLTLGIVLYSIELYWLLAREVWPAAKLERSRKKNAMWCAFEFPLWFGTIPSGWWY